MRRLHEIHVPIGHLLPRLIVHAIFGIILSIIIVMLSWYFLPCGEQPYHDSMAEHWMSWSGNADRSMVYAGFGWRYSFILNRSGTRTAVRAEFGWPYICAGWTRQNFLYSNGKRTTIDGAQILHEEWVVSGAVEAARRLEELTGVDYSKVVPDEFRWWGLFVNACLFGVGSWGFCAIVAELRRRARRRRGECPRCGYILVGTSCPECGWNRPESERAASDVKMSDSP